MFYLRVFYLPFFFFISLFISLASATSLGTQELEFTIPGTDRLVAAEVYYPTTGKESGGYQEEGIWKRKEYAKDAPIAPQKGPYPLVIFSPGKQGDRFGGSWLAEALVDAGYIVVAVDHAKDNSYETSSEFEYTTTWWQRPQDLSALLDYLLKDPKWGPVIDKDRIVAGGFSRGAYTALRLTGIEGDPEAFKKEMEILARWSNWPQSVIKRARAVDWTKASHSYYDPRVKAVFSMAPAFGKGFKPEGLSKAKIPVLLIVGERDTFSPSPQNASFYAAHIPDAELFTVKDAEHRTFLNQCSALGHKVRPDLCKNSSSVNRSKIHEEVAHRIKGFLKEKLNIM